MSWQHAVLLTLGLLPGTLLRAEPVPVDAIDPRIQDIVATVSEAHLQDTVTKLVAFGTRNTLSDTRSTMRGIGAARQWIHDELQHSSPRLQVTFDTYHLDKQDRITRPTELRNVLAILPGRSPRRIYLGAHYDSLNLGAGTQLASNARAPGFAATPDIQQQPGFDPDADAPGANDNGSGVALTMELARVMAQSGVEFDATLVFACWAGEEQDLYGSRAHVQALRASGAAIEAVLNSDIVGGTTGGNGIVDATSVRLYSEGPEDSASRSLARYIERVAAIYVPSHRIRLMAREDRFGRGSDHSSFSNAGFAAISFREARENFARQHATADSVDGVDFRYLLQNARVNAAALASLALAPPRPVISDPRGRPLISRDPTGYDASLRWTASPGAVAYRIYWRDTWSNDWQHRQVTGTVTQFTLKDVSIDDFVFGVAALGAGGQESPVSAYVAPSHANSGVKLAR
jgi:Zn-dependent M28 family amino/carboxypeptidase